MTDLLEELDGLIDYTPVRPWTASQGIKPAEDWRRAEEIAKDIYAGTWGALGSYVTPGGWMVHVMPPDGATATWLAGLALFFAPSGLYVSLHAHNWALLWTCGYVAWTTACNHFTPGDSR